MAIEVTVRDTETGDTSTVILQPGWCVVTCAEPAHVTSEQVYRNGTRVITVKRRATGETP